MRAKLVPSTKMSHTHFFFSAFLSELAQEALGLATLADAGEELCHRVLLVVGDIANKGNTHLVGGGLTPRDTLGRIIGRSEERRVGKECCR